MIDLAIKVAGPIPALLDTRGTVHLNSGRAAKAVEDFGTAVSQEDSPARRFRFAEALWKARMFPAAKDNLSKAHKAGLKASSIHALEREGYRRLCRELNEQALAN